jgi:hypothetical protein
LLHVGAAKTSLGEGHAIEPDVAGRSAGDLNASQDVQLPGVQHVSSSSTSAARQQQQRG